MKHGNAQIKDTSCYCSNFDEKAQSKVLDAIKILDIRVLINNVGVRCQFPMHFHELVIIKKHASVILLFPLTILTLQ